MENALTQVSAEEQAQGYDSQTPIETYITWFEDAEDATSEARKGAERDRDYYDHKQLTAEERAELNRRGQPDVIVNRIQPKINYLIGYEAVNRTDPRAFPRTPQDEDAAAAATDGLRYVEDETALDQTFSGIWENMLIEGYGGLELTVEPAQDGTYDIRPMMWDWDRLFYDPHSRKPDFSDARYVGGVVWMDVEDAKAMWPEQHEIIERTVSEDGKNTYADRPDWQRWTSGKGRKRVRIVQMYHREGNQWWLCKFTYGGKLEAQPVPFVDQRGQSWCPMLLQSAFVDRKNNRYGLVRQMISTQDEINKRRSKALHRLSVRQVRAERGAVDDVDLAKRELAKPDGFLETNPGFEFEILNQSDLAAAELGLLQEAKNEIELMGPNAAMLGQGPDAASGRAIMANQQSGQTEISMLMDRHRHLKKRTFERIWDLIRQFKTEEWWVRVTDDEKNVKFVGFNRPVTVAEELSKRMEGSGMPPEQIQMQMAALQQDPMRAPLLGQVLRMENVPAQMHMDITLEQVPDVANLQEEQFKELVALAPAVTFPPQIYLKASSLRNKQELLEVLDAAASDPVKQAYEQKVAEQALRKAEAEIEKLLAEALHKRVDADLKDSQIGMVQDPRVMPPGAAQQTAAPTRNTPAQQPGF